MLNNQNQSYATLTETTVTMTGTSELHITGSASLNPISRSTFSLNSTDAWLFLEEVKPSLVLSSYLSQITINGAAASTSTNCRVAQYGDGAVIIPEGPSFAPMTVFSGPLFTGSSMPLTQYTAYGDNALGVFANNISSFKLKRGYEATVAQYSNGTGISQNYVAQDGDINVSLLPDSLNNAISFIRVFPWEWVNKKGVAGNPGISQLNVNWWYNWDITSSSTPDLEYVPIRQHGDRPSLDQDWDARGSDQLLGFNEPDRPDQANISVSDAISIWPELEGTGLRVGAPAVSDGGPGWWLSPFMSQASAAGLRVDYLPIHYYQSHDPADPAGCASQMYNFLAGIWNQYHRPIWVTEWNQGANWTGNTPTADQEAADIKAMVDMLENAPFVERYALYNWVGSTRELVSGSSLTAAGTVYRDEQSHIAYTQLTPDQGTSAGAVYHFDGNALDSSGNGRDAILHGGANYTAGQSGTAVTLSGDAASNDYVTLPAQIGDSTDFTFGAWVKWDGGAASQKIFELADDIPGQATKYLYLTPDGGGGVKFAIYNGSTQQELNYSAALPTNTWTHVAVTISGNTGKLFINGSVVATNTGMTINPADIGTAYNYLGRSRKTTDPLFAGQLDDVQFLPYAMTDAQVAKMTTNTAPVFTAGAISGGNGTQGVAYSGTIGGTATDPDGDAITYAKVSGPSWLTVGSNGALSGTPPSTADGLQEFVVSAIDANGASATAALNILLPSFLSNGVWNTLTGQNWNTTSNWSNGVPASGANKLADFSTLNITADKTVTLDGPRTVGDLKFGDTSGTQNWLLSNNNGSVLTLEGDAPTVTVGQNTATISAPIAGHEGLIKSGTGTLALSGPNTYTGDTNVTGGILNLQNSSAVGPNTTVNQAAGARSSALQLQGNISLPTYATFVLSNDGTGTVPYALDNVSGNNAINGLIYLTTGGGNSVVQSDSGALTLNGTIRPYPRNGARTLILQGASTAANTINGVLSNHTSASDVLSLIKTGTGVWRLNGTNTYTGGTTLVIGRLDVGNDSALGTGTLTVNGGTIVPRNGGRTLSNAIVVGGNFTLHDVAGANNTLTLSGGVNLAGATRVITVADAVTVGDGVDTTLSGVISNGGITKAGPGTLALGGANTYTGITTVTAGTLLLAAADCIANASGMVLSGGTFATGGFSETLATVTLSDNSTIDLGAGASTLVYSGAGTFTSGKTLNVTNWTQGSDHLFIGSGAVLTAAQLAQISFGGVAAKQLSTGEVVPVTYSSGTYYWTGDVDGNWSTNVGGNTNWSTDPAGTTDAGQLPDAMTDVVIGATGAANLSNMVLGGDFSIKSLLVTAPTGATIGGANSLTIGAGGITVSSGAGATTINTTGQVILGANQTWTDNASNALTVASVVAGNAMGLTEAGTGTLVLAGSNTYTGGTTIGSPGGAAVIRAGADNALGTGGVFIFGNGGTNRLELSGGITLPNAITQAGRGATVGQTPSILNVSGNNTLAGTVTLTTGGNFSTIQSDGGALTLANAISLSAGSLTGTRGVLFSGTGDISVAGAIDNGTSTAVLQVDKQGAGTLTLAGADTYTGPTTVGAGTLAVTASGASPGSAVTVNGGSYRMTGSGSTFRPASLTVQGSGSAAFDAGGSNTLLVPSLTFSGSGKLDINDDTLIANSATASAATLRGYVSSGRDGGAWDGAGVVSSSAAADPAQTQAVGYALASLLGTTTVAGQTLDPAAIVLKAAQYGDANLDGSVNADDYALVDRGFAMRRTGWVDGDFNYDGQVTPDDYLLIDRTAALLNGGSPDPAILAARQVQFGAAYVAALEASITPPSPEAGILGVPSTVLIQKPVTATGIVTDATTGDDLSGDGYSYRWSVYGARGKRLSSGTGRRITFTPHVPGTYTIILRVADAAGNALEPVTRTVVAKPKAAAKAVAGGHAAKATTKAKRPTVTAKAEHSPKRVFDVVARRIRSMMDRART